MKKFPRLTGFSTPIGGVEWEPRTRDSDVARRLLARFEDRRVLYNPSEAESPMYCAESVNQIRSLLSDSLAELGGHGSLAEHIRAMGASCRKFQNRLGHPSHPDYNDMSSWGHWRSWQFQDALGQLRGVFGLHIAAISARYNILVPEPLAAILPLPPAEDDLNA